MAYDFFKLQAPPPCFVRTIRHSSFSVYIRKYSKNSSPNTVRRYFSEKIAHRTRNRPSQAHSRPSKSRTPDLLIRPSSPNRQTDFRSDFRVLRMFFIEPLVLLTHIRYYKVVTSITIVSWSLVAGELCGDDSPTKYIVFQHIISHIPFAMTSAVLLIILSIFLSFVRCDLAAPNIRWIDFGLRTRCIGATTFVSYRSFAFELFRRVRYAFFRLSEKTPARYRTSGSYRHFTTERILCGRRAGPPRKNILHPLEDRRRLIVCQ